MGNLFNVNGQIEVIVPNLRNESTEICARGGFFVLRTKFDFLTIIFDGVFLSFKNYCCSELKFEKTFHLRSFFVKLWEFKDWSILDN